MDNRKTKRAREIVGIRHNGKVSCLNCVSLIRIRTAGKANRIRRKDVEDSELNVCDFCRKPLF